MLLEPVLSSDKQRCLHPRPLHKIKKTTEKRKGERRRNATQRAFSSPFSARSQHQPRSLGRTESQTHTHTLSLSHSVAVNNVCCCLVKKTQHGPAHDWQKQAKKTSQHDRGDNRHHFLSLPHHSAIAQKTFAPSHAPTHHPQAFTTTHLPRGVGSPAQSSSSHT